MELEAKQKIIRKNMLGSYLGFQMSKKRVPFVVRHMAGSKGLSSSLALIKAQKQKKVPQDSIMTTGNQ